MVTESSCLVERQYITANRQIS